jgi:hypothetical protein
MFDRFRKSSLSDVPEEESSRSHALAGTEGSGATQTKNRRRSAGEAAGARDAQGAAEAEGAGEETA